MRRAMRALRRIGLLALLALGGVPLARAEVTAAAPDHFTLRHEAVSSLPPDALWARLTEPAAWWSSAHTYSGDAANLSLDTRPGGLWSEAWEAGTVAHGRVLFARDGRTLRLDAPFGPLQGMAVSTVWTVTLTPEADGTRVRFDVVANGSERSGLDALAPAVDSVFTEAIGRLASPAPQE